MGHNFAAIFISATGVVLAASIGLVGLLITRSSRGSRPFFYLMLVAGLLNIAVALSAGPLMREFFNDDAVSAAKLMFIVSGIGSLVIAFVNRRA